MLILNQAPFQYPIRRLIVRSREVSKPGDWLFKLSHRFEIWQALRQPCCRGACQISERSDNSKYKSRGFDTFAGFYSKTSYRILKLGPAGVDCWIRLLIYSINYTFRVVVTVNSFQMPHSLTSQTSCDFLSRLYLPFIKYWLHTF